MDNRTKWKFNDLFNRVIEVGHLYCEDIQYGDYKSIIPTNLTLEQYFEVMGDLEQLFSKLYKFTSYNQGSYVGENKLYICYNDSLIELSLIEGQGSEFCISFIEPLEFGKYDKDVEQQFIFYENEIVFSEELFYLLSSMNLGQQAIWYLKYVLDICIPLLETDKLANILLRMTNLSWNKKIDYLLEYLHD